MRSRAYISRVGVEGALIVLSSLPFLFPIIESELLGNKIQLSLASISFLSLFICALILFSKPMLAKSLGIIAAVSCYSAVWRYILNNSFIALAATVLLIGSIFFFSNFDVYSKKRRKSDHNSRREQKARWGVLMVPLIIVISILLGSASSTLTLVFILVSLTIAFVLYLLWQIEKKSKFNILFSIIGFVLGVSFSAFNDFNNFNIMFVLSLFAFLSFPHQKKSLERKDHWGEVLIGQPARFLLITFLGLCVMGTILLSLSVSTNSGSIDMVDAIFTSVSAVCVTGLTVVDTHSYFTSFGQFCILLLIQLGGLGIMSIMTVAMHAMGRRLSLKQERLLTSMADTDHKDLIDSLKLILRFTFIAEGVGAILLSILFYFAGDTLNVSIWKGFFTSISAFCNAGFALQSDSLISYQSNALILHTISILIIVGGMAPAMSMIIPKWISGKPIPISARIALVTMTILLVLGTFFIMAFEWNGILANLSVADKIHNAWFQSVTIRTAGFNSVDLSKIISPTFIILVVWMFIGGSPGGTAGGVKTTTIGILFMTFWANIRNRNAVVIQNRRIHLSTINRAITVIISGLVIWFVVVLMLEVTQQIPARDLIFEATSAIGTVGLSTGATALLDEIGKIIIIIAMFLGRIGPMTLFMLISEENSSSYSRYPEEKISIA